MPGLVPGIHRLSGAYWKTWMAGTSPAMTLRNRYVFSDYNCPSSVSPPETSTVPGFSSMLSFFTTPSSTSME